MQKPRIGQEYVLNVGYVTDMGDKVESHDCKGVDKGHRFKLITVLGDDEFFDYSLMSAEQHGDEAPMLKLTSDVFQDVLKQP